MERHRLDPGTIRRTNQRFEYSQLSVNPGCRNFLNFQDEKVLLSVFWHTIQEISINRSHEKTHFRDKLLINFSLLSLDISVHIRDSIEELMKTIRLFQRDSRPKSYGGDSQIRVYRSHAARAISEERWEVAEIFLDRILKVDPDHTEAWLMKGHLRHHCREDEQTAVDCYRKVIRLCGHDSAHPHAERARSSLGRLLAVWS